jgi:hypothetical protein
MKTIRGNNKTKELWKVYSAQHSIRDAMLKDIIDELVANQRVYSHDTIRAVRGHISELLLEIYTKTEMSKQDFWDYANKNLLFKWQNYKGEYHIEKNIFTIDDKEKL